MSVRYRYQGGYPYRIVGHDGRPVTDNEQRITNANTLLDKELAATPIGATITLMGWTYQRLPKAAE